MSSQPFHPVVESKTAEAAGAIPRSIVTAPRRLPELLAPAGDWDCAKAAVENGADAIYFGLEKFNARMRAHNFTDADLPRLMEFLHLRGVKGYVTFNTLIFQNELPTATQYLRTIISAGVDAAIVQDVGICRLIRELSPDFPIHVSTQMTITSAGGVEFARQLGCNLVVLARECSLKDIAKIVASEAAVATHSASGICGSLPIEVFVHGALCVAYSGQCLTSEALGGRSANRGECAQACRMPYGLIADGKEVQLGDKKYLLSPQDLAGLEILDELVSSGVASLKIEGRLKSPEYVANITRIYRKALDKLGEDSAKQNGEQPPLKGSQASTTAKAEDFANANYEMQMAFSRGLHTGWFRGNNNQALVHARFGKKRGVYLGQVDSVHNGNIRIRLESPLKPGDGVVFDAGHPEQQEEGGRVYQVRENGSGLSEIGFGREDLDPTRIQKGDRLWKTSDPELERRLRQTFAGDLPKFQRPITLEVHGHTGSVLTLVVRDGQGNIVKLNSKMPLVKAEKQPLTTGRLEEQLGRLGGTPFRLGSIDNQLEGPVLLPMSELNRLRRETVTELEGMRRLTKRWRLESSNVTLPSAVANRAANSDGVKLIVMARNFAQLEAAAECGIETIYCEFEDPKKYREATQIVSGLRNGGNKLELFVAPPRIFRTGEEWTLNQVRSCEADGYLVRNYDHLSYFKDARKIGDFSLNIANRLTAEYFRNQFGLERVTASYDLNFAQLESLLEASPPEWFEVTIHQHIPMFHMEHCVFCAFLSNGTDYTNCGRPCDTHDLKLRDRVGMEHPVKADAGCRNTVFNGLAQTGAEFVEPMLALGVRNFRIEFLNEKPEQVCRSIEKYRQLLRGEISGGEVWRELKLLNQLGVTRGQLASR